MIHDRHSIEGLERVTRRHFFGTSAAGIGGLALGSLLAGPLAGTARAATNALPVSNLQIPPRVKRVIYLFQAGGPAQQDLFDYKPLLNEQNGQQLPDHVRGGQRLTGMSAQQASIPLAGSAFKFAQHGQSGAWLSEAAAPHRRIVDDLCIVKSMFTEAINHDPAITFFQTGSQIAGRPSIGAWLSYGLGSMNDNLPSFIVLVSANQADQPLYARLWGSGFLDSKYQGVQLPLRQGPGAVPEQPRRHLPLGPRRDARQTQRARTATNSSRSSTPRSNRASPSTKWRSACRPACPTSPNLVGRAGLHVRALRRR